jgi:hypothetical protein
MHVRSIMPVAVALLHSVVSSPASAQVVDTTAALNQLLRTKPQLSFTRIIQQQQHGCSSHTLHVGSPPVQICSTWTEPVSQQYVDFAQVTSTKVIGVENVQLETSRIVTLPEDAKVQMYDYANCASGTLGAQVSLAISGTESTSVTGTQAVSTTEGASFSLTAKLTAGTLGTTFSVNQTVSTSASQTNSQSTTVPRTFTGTETAAPGDSGEIELLAYQTTVQIPYTATVVVDGPLEPNNSGKAMASSLLSAQERTFQLSGVLTATNVSDASVRANPLPGPTECTGSNVGQLVTQTRNTSN